MLYSFAAKQSKLCDGETNEPIRMVGVQLSKLRILTMCRLSRQIDFLELSSQLISDQRWYGLLG
jgi:hypothetical protein